MYAIKRDMLSALSEHLEHREMTLITGPRQAGKTTLMIELMARLKSKGQQSLLLNLDREIDQPHFESQAQLIQKLRLELGETGGFVFIDEIQRKINAGLFLKGLYDSNLPYKFIISGSGSLELKEKIHESLAGRKRLFSCPTVSLGEFFHYRTNYRYRTIGLQAFSQIESAQADLLLTEYLNFGGYPQVVLVDKQSEKQRYIDEIISSTLEKDIQILLQIERADAFRQLIRLLAAQSGQLINYSALSNAIGISVATIKKYLWYAESTFIITLVSPFFNNIKKEITKAPMVYFNDLGFRNYMLNRFGSLDTAHELGLVFQNLVFHCLLSITQFTAASVHFWRSKDKAEVDFVIRNGNDLIPIEVKYTAFKQSRVSRSYRHFIGKYSPRRGYIINRNLKEITKIDSTEVHFISIWELLELKDFV